jgi:hypothetical protein
MYVLKFRGAGQGVKALIAELIAGELGRAIGLRVPELVFVELDPDLARTEPDPEIQSLIRASDGLNLALDYLPGSVMFNPIAEKPEACLASEVVWFDAFITNVDRTARNTNMLMWHRKLWLIDHGAGLYFHHSWNNYLERSRDPFTLIKNHVLLKLAAELREADARLSIQITREMIETIVKLVPVPWLTDQALFGGVDQQRKAYVDYLTKRLEPPHDFMEEAIRARSIYL